ncbi:DUF4148 domain-containing protein [Paraburkholderia dipogonis]|uniref:DUF4148 domain-containing protein n=1 Tax=Paraburkholderia dipogonis TaxID=1211383 RepID=A0A4Y8MPI3_9BURK|nr:DUF4148 domain-containing protein [Paraburkholderia dipogonis]TFE39324.1 DUF4148 domain-containing protein [Paraburkholderia dipogonis]
MELTSLNRLMVRAAAGALVASATLLATASGAYAQTSATPGTHQLTRAEVRHELEELEAAGYDPSRGDESDYPADIQEAERKVAAMHAAQQSALNNNQPAMQDMPMH